MLVKLALILLVKSDYSCSWSIILVDSNPGMVISEYPLISSTIVEQMLM